MTAVTVQAYTIDDVIADTGSVFTGDSATGGASGLSYVKVSDDVWVEAVDQSGVATQEVAFDDGTTMWAVDTSATPGTVTTASVSDLEITSATTAGQLDQHL